MRLLPYTFVFVTIIAAAATSVLAFGQTKVHGRGSALKIEIGTIAPKDTPWYQILERMQD